jgi:hypothetical protein
MNIQQFRQQYPQYNDISDMDLAKKLHAKNYSDMSFDDFANRFGITKPTFKGGQGGEFRGQGATGEWEPESFLKQGIGRLAVGSAQVGQALLEQPGRFVRNAGLIRQWSMAEDVLRETDPEKQKQLRQQMALSRQSFDQVADALDTPAGEYQKGLDEMLKNHPEWKHNPPDSFIELLTNPKEAALAVAEALPLLVGAGIATVTGHTNVAKAMIFTSESKIMSDQAFQDTGDKYIADMSGILYGTVSAALEGMQLEGLINITKGWYRPLANRTVQKVAAKGLKDLSYSTIKIAAQEALEEMSQGAWQEFTAKAVYGKDVPGGLAGFIDRRAQEVYLAALLSGVAGAGGAGLGTLQQATTPQETQPAVDVTSAQTSKPLSAEVFRAERVSPVTGERQAADAGFYGQGTYYSATKEGAARYGEAKAHKIELKNPLVVATPDQLYTAIAEVSGPEFVVPPGQIARPKVSREISRVLKEQGYDGLIIKNPYKAEAPEIVVFSETKPVAEVERLPEAQPPGPEPATQERQPTSPEAMAEEMGQAGDIQLYVKPDGTPVADKNVKYDKTEQGLQNPHIIENGNRIEVEFSQELSKIANQAYRAKEAKPTKMAEAKPKEPKPKLTKPKARDLGHTIPDLLGWSDVQRRDFMQELVGRRTMKGMSRDDMNTVVEALQKEAGDQGIELEENLPVIPVNDLISTLETTKKKTEEEVYKTLNRGQIKSLSRKMKSGVYSFATGLERMERFFESLDGHKAGAFTENIYKPVKQADELATEFTNQDKTEFIDYLEEQDINPDIWAGKAEEIPNTKFKLTPFQRIGVHMFSLNENGHRHLVEGMGFTEKDIAIINESLSTQEKEVANWLSDKYEKQWKVLQNIGVNIGIDPKKLKKEVFYSPIIRTDADLEGQQNFLTGLSDAFQGENFDPEHKFLEQRKPTSRGKIELDAAVLYMNNIARTQRFIQVAPTAHSIGRLLNNKNFRVALNDRTYNQGIKLVNKWMHDAVRGSVIRDGTQLSKAINIMRRNGIIYAIGYNIPSSLRQTLSLSNAVAVDKAMLKYTPINLAKAFTPKGFKELQDFVYARSLSVKHASFDRDLRRITNRKNIRKQLKGKLEWSQKAISWIRWMDRHTRVVAWKSLYDVGMGKFNGDEVKAIDYADKWIERTQPMATAKDLPHFFRGGQLEQLLTTFQNQVNNNANFYIYDILGATKSGEITLTEAGYRTMFSYVLPAILYGMIGRGGLPRNLKDVLIDLTTYPIAGLVIVGRWITAMIRGWDSGSTIAEAAPQQANRLVKAIKRGDTRDIISGAAGTIGAVTSRIPAQPIRTVEGAIDLYTGETTDPRRLIYSEWALNQGKKEKKKVKMYGGGL